MIPSHRMYLCLVRMGMSRKMFLKFTVWSAFSISRDTPFSSTCRILMGFNFLGSGHTTLSGIGDSDYQLQPIQMCCTDSYRCTPLQVLSDGTLLHEDRPLPCGDDAPMSRCQVVHLPDFDVDTDAEDWSRLQESDFDHAHLQRALLPNAHLALASTFWSWWRSQSKMQNPSTHYPYLKARKFLHSTDQWINLPQDVLQDLIWRSKGAVIQTVESLATTNGSCAISRLQLQDMFTVIDEYVDGIPYLPCNSVDSQARGIGNMVAFWERMRNVCPKINTYSGPILMKDGTQCLTSRDLDSAMLATRTFALATCCDSVLVCREACFVVIPLPRSSCYFGYAAQRLVVVSRVLLVAFLSAFGKRVSLYCSLKKVLGSLWVLEISGSVKFRWNSFCLNHRVANSL